MMNEGEMFNEETMEANEATSTASTRRLSWRLGGVIFFMTFAVVAVVAYVDGGKGVRGELQALGNGRGRVLAWEDWASCGAIASMRCYTGLANGRVTQATMAIRGDSLPRAEIIEEKWAEVSSKFHILRKGGEVTIDFYCAYIYAMELRVPEMYEVDNANCDYSTSHGGKVGKAVCTCN